MISTIQNVANAGSAAIESASGGKSPTSLTLQLEDGTDVSRAELICHPHEAPAVARELGADVCRMAEQPCAVARARCAGMIAVATPHVDRDQDR
jgi:sulfate adenylyltransferase subunit 1 (EFTu-like GTPase family)